MGKKRLLLICTLFLCIILTRAKTTEAQQPTCKIIVHPSYYEVSAPGEEFEIYINITDAPEIDFWAIQNITWDPNIIELRYGNESDFVEGSYMQPYGTTGFVVTGINQTAGRVEEAMNGYLTISYRPPGSGDLFKILFRGKAVGSTMISMESAYLLNSKDPDWYLLPELESGSVVVIPEFSNLLLPLFLVTTAASALIASKIKSKKR